MKTKLTQMFELDVPIFAFSHCRDVVAAVSKAGGMGVLGAAWMTPEHLEQELDWIDAHVDGKPYGVDMVFAAKAQPVEFDKTPREVLPDENRKFINDLLTEDGVPELPESELEDWYADYARNLAFTRETSEALLDVAMRHPIRLVVSALGVAPPEIISNVQDKGIKFGAMIGSSRHAAKQIEAGVDLLIAQGSEAGGHVGNVSTMVLVPEVVDAAGDIPVLAAGGIGRGRQMAAALALGAEGVWTGSIWLGTTESELTPDMRELLHATRSEDAVVTVGYTGKPCRSMASKFTEAWARPDAPAPLGVPFQSILSGEPFRRAERAGRKDWMTYACGQVAGRITEPTTVRQVFYDMLTEYVDTMERAQSILED